MLRGSRIWDSESQEGPLGQRAGVCLPAICVSLLPFPGRGRALPAQTAGLC